ncbi:XrtA/PEP-CTERM system histidine kinase PrsK [Massilia cavernae]|uniref:histidine kinase n=1 Tax=Massilia cavernae TaxID=2320864 RepID=A0A418XU92_9BURK|nr:XrtA/PEP-CTERM system histidine kinase PrsK [Massilia cavernae]RJG16280.1 PEP-CTERM system histidine kinase PrsK [Massilia cavernae]
MTSIATFSYATCAAAFLLLGLLLASSWRGRPHSRALAAACTVTALWALAIALQAPGDHSSDRWVNSLGILRSAAWSGVLVLLSGNYRKESGKMPFRLQPALVLGAAFYLLYLLGTAAGQWSIGFANERAFIPSVAASVGLAVLGMLLVEQLYRNKPVQERWAIKFACIGIGGMFAYDFYLYSDTMLFRQINPDIWAARGIINTLTVPLLAFSIARSASWSTELAVSRRVMFHSAALFGSAIYLLAMGSAGYYLRYFGGSWGTVMQVSFLFGALVLLVGILFSGTFRAWLKVVISKHFYTYNYDYREEWLRFTRTLSEHGPGLGQRVIQAVGALVESPGGALWIRRESGHCVPAAAWHAVLPSAEEPLDSPFCCFLEQREWVVDLQEYAQNPDKYDSVPLPEWLAGFQRGWLVVPLILQGRLFGMVVLQRPRSPINLNWEVIDLLKIAGSQAASYLAQEEAGNALMVARQFESFNRMSTFVVHDLKNLVSQLSLLTSNAEKHKDNPEFQRDMLETLDFSVQKMRLLLQRLGRSVAPSHPAPLALDHVLREAVADKAAFEPRPSLDIGDATLKVVADHERLERVLGHLIQNAIEATARNGRISIRMARKGDAAEITISDTGEGMSEEFIRDRLFKPFESTKSAGMGIGVFESREYISELGGALEVTSSQPGGTTFKIMLPLHGVEAETVNIAA